MDLNEIVETSDVEELEEIQVQKSKNVQLARQDVLHDCHSTISFSPRKRIKLHHLYTEHVHSPSSVGSLLSVASTPRRSESSIETLDQSPPGLSSVHPHKPHNEVVEEIGSFEDIFGTQNSQDPLLLHAPYDELRLPKCSHSSLTPRDISSQHSTQHQEMSPLSQRPLDVVFRSASRRSASVDPLTLCVSEMDTSRNTTPPPARETISPEASDDNMKSLFGSSPSKYPSTSNTCSPPLIHHNTITDEELSPTTTPTRPLSPMSTLSPDNSASDMRQVAPQDYQISPPGLAQRTEEGSRYSLRQRQAVQLAPYSVDKLNYRRALVSIPDAIIKIRSPRHHQHRSTGNSYEEDEETQGTYVYDAEDEDEDGSWEARERRRLRIEGRAEAHRSPERSPMVGNDRPEENRVISEVLQDLPSDDEETRRQIAALSKEARKSVREQERKAKEEARKEAERKRKEKKDNAKLKARRFPELSKRIEGVGLNGQVHDDSSSENGLQQNRVQSSPNIRQASIESQDVARELTGQDEVGDVRQHSMQIDHIAETEGQPMIDNTDITQNNTVPVESTDGETDEGTYPTYEEHNEISPPVSDEDAVDALSRRQLRALQHMVPAFMAQRLVGGQQPQSRARSRRRSESNTESTSEAEEVRVLLPGQTRVRHAKVTNIANIKGDTESSSEERGSPQSKDEIGVGSYQNNASPPQDIETDSVNFERRNKQEHNELDIIELSDGDEDDQSSESSGIDDEDIQAYLGGNQYVQYPTRHQRQQTTRSTRRTEESLIDWMLSKSHTIGPKKKPHNQKPSAASPSSRKRIDVMTRDGRRYGRERQTLLNFDKHGKKPRSLGPKSNQGSSRTLQRSTSSFRNRPNNVSGSDGSDFDNHPPIRIPQIMVDNQGHRKESRKAKEKARKSRARLQGLYTFNNSNANARIISGRRKQVVTIDLEDEGFHQALAPVIQERIPAQSFFNPRRAKISRSKSSPSSVLLGNRVQRTGVNRDIPIENDFEPNSNNPTTKRRNIRPDMNIPILASGIKFGPNTYIAKGWLYELISVISSASEVSKPSVLTSCGVTLDPEMTLEDYLESLTKVIDGVIDFVTNGSGVDSNTQAREWKLVMRTVSQLVSWFFASQTEDRRQILREGTKCQVMRLLTEMGAHSFSNDASNGTILSVNWFAVELSIRLGSRLPIQAGRSALKDNILSESAALLLKNLLNYDLQKTMEPILNGSEYEESSISWRCVELWVLLIHVLERCVHTAATERATKSSHPLWQLVKSELQSADLHKTNIEICEEIWRVVFSLCSLSQFSVHGMTTGTPRLTASWDLVVFALKKIRVTADPATDHALPLSSLRKRDEYICLVTRRCFLLWDRWRWRLDDASQLFNQLVEIFRSRKFANLRHEKSEYPTFMTQHDWTLLSQFSDTDTAFEIFLKFIVQAAGTEATVNAKGKLLPKVKKLLSLAIPVGTLPFTKANPPDPHDLSMLYNRLGSAAIGLYLDPEHYSARISHARTYVDFKAADETTRANVIRGMGYIAILNVKSGTKLDAIADWIEEMVLVLVQEFKDVLDSGFTAYNAPIEGNSVISRIILIIGLLIRSVYFIVKAQKDEGQYPEPSFLSKLRRLMNNVHEINALEPTVRDLVEVYLDARTAIIPPPDRPHGSTTTEAESESQELYGNFDFDLDDPNLIAALDGQVSKTPDIETKEAALQKAIAESNLAWFSYKYFKKYFRGPQASDVYNAYAKQSDAWIKCWLGCADAHGRPTGNERTRLHLCMNQWRSWTKDTTDEIWHRRLDVGFMLRFLQLDSKAYLVFVDTIFEVFMQSLVCSRITIEGDFIAWVLSIDCLQHALFRGMDCLPPLESGDYHITATQLQELRLPILQVIFKNLNETIFEAASGRFEKQLNADKYLGYCIKIFPVMRYNLQKHGATNEEYKKFCRELFLELERYPEIQRHERVGFARWKQMVD